MINAESNALFFKFGKYMLVIAIYNAILFLLIVITPYLVLLDWIFNEELVFQLSIFYEIGGTVILSILLMTSARPIRTAYNMKADENLKRCYRRLIIGPLLVAVAVILINLTLEDPFGLELGGYVDVILYLVAFWVLFYGGWVSIVAWRSLSDFFQSRAGNYPERHIKRLSNGLKFLQFSAFLFILAMLIPITYYVEYIMNTIGFFYVGITLSQLKAFFNQK